MPVGQKLNTRQLIVNSSYWMRLWSEEFCRLREVLSQQITLHRMHILDHTKVDLFYCSFKMIHHLKTKENNLCSIKVISGHPLRCVCYYSCYVFKQVGWLFLLCKLCEILSVFSSSTTAAQLMQTQTHPQGFSVAVPFSYVILHQWCYFIEYRKCLPNSVNGSWLQRRIP